jgi:glycosyltransferase involved in cell wall biosynthesis
MTMDASLPIISVVVPTRNQAEFLPQCLDSLLGQNYPNLELIIIDGASTDSTPAVLERYRNKAAVCISEPDKGQADAINKGFAHATGSIFCWLNSDDMQLPGTLHRVATHFLENPHPHVACGGIILYSDIQGKSYLIPPLPLDYREVSTAAFIGQPAAFWTREVWEKTGRLNEDYHYVLDWDWFIRASKVCPFAKLPHVLALYRIHPAHKSSQATSTRNAEIINVYLENGLHEYAEAYRKIQPRAVEIARSLKFLKACHTFGLHRIAHPILYSRFSEKVVERILWMALPPLHD